MKHILLPTDFSDNALNAIHCALKIYKEVRCSFHILNAYTLSAANLMDRRTAGSLGNLYEAVEEASERGLKELVDELRKNNCDRNHTFYTMSKPDQPLDAIKEVVSQNDVDLIVMGTKGATGAKKVFLGSNTVKVIMAVNKCPVLAVPESYTFQGLKKLMFPTDFTRPFSKLEFYGLIELAKLWKPNIRIFHLTKNIPLTEEQINNKKTLKKFLIGLDYSFYNGIVDDTITESIQKFVAEKQADMVALLHYKRTFIERLTEKAVIKKVGFETKVPLLVLPEKSTD